MGMRPVSPSELAMAHRKFLKSQPRWQNLESQEKGSEELKQDMMASANDKIRWHMEYFWADAETVGFPTFSVPQPTENVADDRRRLAEGYSEYVSRLTRLLYPHGSGCAVKTTLSCPK